jgi:hypothetical protein
MTFWDEFWNEINNNTGQGGYYNNYYRHQIGDKNETFIGRLTRQLADINNLLAEVISNKLPKSQVLQEKVSLDSGKTTIDLIIERTEDDGTIRKYKIKVEEIAEGEEPEEDSEEPEETTDYFTP